MYNIIMSNDWVENPLTGRYVKIGSRVHKTLVSTGIIDDGLDSEPDDYNDYNDNNYDDDYNDNDDEYKESEINDDYNDYDDYKDTDDGKELSPPPEDDEDDEYDNLQTLPNEIDVDNMNDEEIEQLYELLKNFNKK